jgi:hypothetical protein
MTKPALRTMSNTIPTILAKAMNNAVSKNPKANLEEIE